MATGLTFDGDEIELVHQCTKCDNIGVYRYAPRDSNILNEDQRWLCELHGSYYFNDPEWDYYGLQ